MLRILVDEDPRTLAMRRREEKSLSSRTVTSSKLTIGLLLLLSSTPTTLFTEARLVHVVSYTTMVGLAGQSNRWKHAMEEQLALASKKSAEATELQEAAAEDQAAADELAEKSTAEKEASEALEEEADTLYSKAEMDEAKAATTEEEAEGLATDAAEKEAQSTALVAEAAAEEIVVEEETAQATAEAAMAAKDAEAAEADEATTAVCQVIPIVDAVCDVVGGVAAVALESQAVRNAALAAENFAGAAAAQTEVNSATAEATELSATAAEEGEEATALHSETTSLEAKAEEKIEGAKADEAAAKEELEQSVVDESRADKEEAESLTEEDASAKAWQESLHYGTNACGNAIMMGFVSAVSLLFWGVRLFWSFALPTLKTTFSYLGGLLGCGKLDALPSTSEVLVTGSHVHHHLLITVACFGVWGDTLIRLRHLTSLRAMGGAVLGFAATVAATQSIVMHSIERMWHHNGTWQSTAWAGFCEFFRRFLCYCPLVVMETLLAWVNAGRWVFVQDVVERAQSIWLWLLLLSSLLVHYFFLFRRTKAKIQPEIVLETEQARLVTEGDIEGSEGELTVSTEYGALEAQTIDDNEDWEPIVHEPETEALLGTHTLAIDVDHEENVDAGIEDVGFVSNLADDFRRLRLVLVFELLMASVILSLLMQSTPIIQWLWPASKAALLDSYSQWPLAVGLSSAVAALLLIFACI